MLISCDKKCYIQYALHNITRCGNLQTYRDQQYQPIIWSQIKQVYTSWVSTTILKILQMIEVDIYASTTYTQENIIGQ